VDDMLLGIIPKAAELVHCDPEYSVVMAALETYTELLKELKEVVLKGEGHKEAIINCIKAVLMNEVRCGFFKFFIRQNTT
jgi:importin-4